ncbi:DUF4079 domain-containing protein [Acaryochloris marina]|uniref:DUF4079 domain-containing protein n=1 Tax=Acaryochloris marina (strain MBIC 11017) TaxID=329726 RepID=B0CAV4_ACAM1|nr:DUF4079 domain-containing protein [Acaryochloris marina]ABW30305.1 conserved hypothetical protein [Acaryochloris marina MBIC11017]BDM79128.1 hypothetical protein AM10699_19960 [Acaryochloris marina MBIC10699]
MTLSKLLYWIYTFIHPVLMWTLFGICIYAMTLGLKVRTTRTTPDKDLRKSLIKQRFNIKHHQIGAILLSIMVLGSIGGMGVTYINNGKLFVGAHLLAGLGMTGLVAILASLTPLMQRGSQTARDVHLWLSVLILGLFGWEAITGMQIVQRIIEQG